MSPGAPRGALWGGAATGLLLVLGFPPFRLGFVPFLALVPFALAVEGLPGDRDGRRGAFLVGAVTGGVAWSVLLYWMPLSLGRFWPVSIAGYLAAVGALAGLTGCVGWALHRLRRPGRASPAPPRPAANAAPVDPVDPAGAGGVGGAARSGVPAVPLWLALPLAWVAGEWLRAHLPGPLAFPWLELSVSLAHAPPLVGSAELVGSRGVSFLVALANGLLATAVLRWDGPGSEKRTGSDPVDEDGGEGAAGRGASGPARGIPAVLGWTAAALLLPAAMAAWGAWRAGALDYETAAPVTVVETAVPQPVKLDRGRVTEATLEALRSAMSGAAAETRMRGSALVLLPEAVLPVDLRSEAGGEVRRFLEDRARVVGTPILVGSVGRAEGAPVNAAYLVTPRGGLRPGAYHKRHLVPFVERVPLVPVPWLDLQGRFGSYRPGEGWPVARVEPAAGTGAWIREGASGPAVAVGPEQDGGPGGGGGGEGMDRRDRDPLVVGAFICFESTFGSVTRGLRREGAELLVNLTNDAWLGGDGSLPATLALWQHPAHLVLRAVETRTPVVRAANTGPSVMVDPSGRTSAHAPAVEPGLRDFIPRTTRVRTAFVRLGDVVGTASVGVVLVLLLGGAVRRRGRRHTACY